VVWSRHCEKASWEIFLRTAQKGFWLTRQSRRGKQKSEEQNLKQKNHERSVCDVGRDEIVTRTFVTLINCDQVAEAALHHSQQNHTSLSRPSPMPVLTPSPQMPISITTTGGARQGNAKSEGELARRNVLREGVSGGQQKISRQVFGYPGSPAATLVVGIGDE